MQQRTLAATIRINQRRDCSGINGECRQRQDGFFIIEKADIIQLAGT